MDLALSGDRFTLVIDEGDFCFSFTLASERVTLRADERTRGMMPRLRSLDHGALARTERHEMFLFACGGVMLEVYLAWQRFPGPRKYRTAIASGPDALWDALMREERVIVSEALEICAARSREAGRLPTERSCLLAITRVARARRYRVGKVLLFLIYVRTPLDAALNTAMKLAEQRRIFHAREISDEASCVPRGRSPGYDTY